MNSYSSTEPYFLTRERELTAAQHMLRRPTNFDQFTAAAMAAQSRWRCVVPDTGRDRIRCDHTGLSGAIGGWHESGLYGPKRAGRGVHRGTDRRIDIP